MKRTIITICLLSLTGSIQLAHAQLGITEVMSGETDKNHPDWWGLHNYGTNDIDLTGYSWNDDAHGGFSGADTAPFTGVIIHANETIAVTEQKGSVIDGDTFRSWWGVGAGVQVVVLNAADPGLSASPLVSGTKRCDSVRLWSTNMVALGANTNGLDLDECSDYLVQRVDLGVTVSQSVRFDPLTGVYDILSTNGVNGAFAAASVATDIGSPGISQSPVPAVIAQTPLSQERIIGDSVSFTNGGVALPTLSFHWFFNNTPLVSSTPRTSIHHYTPGIANALTNEISVLTITGVQTTDAGSYKVIASNGLQSFTNSFTLAVSSTPTAPEISIAPPPSLEAYIPQSVPLTVAASGFPSPSIQWYSNNVALPGQTANTLLLALSDTNQSATYSAKVSNSAGSTNVSTVLNVTPKPDLVITEVMSGESTNSSNGDVTGHGDWFELSNFGNFTVNLYGYRIDDSHNSIAQTASVQDHVFIHPGESVVFVQGMTPDQFRTWWGPQLPASVQIIDYNGAGQGLSGSGDEVHLWNAAATANDDQVAQVSFLAGTDGVTFGFIPTATDETGFYGFAPDGLSVVGVNGAFAAAVGGDIGSPGTIVTVPRITSLVQTNGGFKLTWANQPNWNYTVQYKNNLSDATWTTLTNVTSDASSTFSIVDPAVTGQRYYRVGLAP